MGIIDKYLKAYNTGMLGEDKREDKTSSRFWSALGQAQANKQGGSRPTQGGQSFSNALSGMQQGMIDDEAQRNADNSFVGPNQFGSLDDVQGEIPAMTPLQRLQKQATTLMQSNNEEAQKMGVDLFKKHSEYKNRNLNDTKSKDMKEYDYAVNTGQFGGTLQEWIQGGKTKMYEGSGDKAYTPSQLKNLSPPKGKEIPTNLTPNQAAAQGFTLKQDANQTTQGATIDAMDLGLEDLFNVIDKGKGDGTGVGTVLRNQGGLVGEGINAAMNFFGMKSTEDEVKFTNANRKIAGAIVKLMSGAAATDTEYDRWAMIQPRETDDDDVRKWKYDQMIDFAASLSERASKGGVTGIPDFKKARKFSDSKPDDTSNVEDPNNPGFQTNGLPVGVTLLR